MQLKVEDHLFTEEELENTPLRWERFWDEWRENRQYEKFTTFKSDNYNQMVVHSANFYSMCAHHLLPFFGKAWVGYIPNDKLLGLSKLARLVDKYAHAPQEQERLTVQVADALIKVVGPRGVGVVMKARHLCEEMRGQRAAEALTTTSALRGDFLNKPNMRAEFLGWVK